jgi:hypothetical protein
MPHACKAAVFVVSSTASAAAAIDRQQKLNYVAMQQQADRECQ